MDIMLILDPTTGQYDDAKPSTGSETLFGSLAQARRIIEDWRIDYNGERPHTSLNGLTPTEFAARPDQGHNRNRLYL